jgi:TRAP-type mannitol/chloroaromatic compound transport system substrate-binding protein
VTSFCIAAKNADFRKVHDHVMAYRGDRNLWWQIAAYTFDTCQIRARRRP